MAEVTQNKVLEKLRLFNSQWKDVNPTGGGSDWPDNGKHVVLLTGVNVREGQVYAGKAKVAGITIGFKMQLVDDPERETPRKFVDVFRFADDTVAAGLSEDDRQKLSYDRDRFGGYVKVILGSIPGGMQESVQALIDDLNANSAISLRINVASNNEGKYKKAYALERIPLGSLPPTETPTNS